MEVKERYGWATLLIEDSPISRGLIQSLREQSINVTTHKPETDKRAPPLEFGNRSIYLVRSGEDFELDFGNSQSLATRHVSCAPSLD